MNRCHLWLKWCIVLGLHLMQTKLSNKWSNSEHIFKPWINNEQTFNMLLTKKKKNWTPSVIKCKHVIVFTLHSKSPCLSHLRLCDRLAEMCQHFFGWCLNWQILPSPFLRSSYLSDAHLESGLHCCDSHLRAVICWCSDMHEWQILLVLVLL